MFAKLRNLLFQPVWVGRAVRFALILFFIWLTARHWHPIYGLTRFLQCDATAESSMLPSLRGARLFVHSDPGTYDGFYYAQIATSPALREPGLRAAIDDLGYRSRRILLSAVAWAVALGDPAATLEAYAWLNVIGWLVLAILLWRLFPADGWRGTLAWTGTMFATGTLISVRLALTDLAALLLTAAAIMQLEHGRRGLAGGLLGFAGLARETALLAVVALLPDQNAARRSRLSVVLSLAAALLPLALWLVYIWITIGPSGPGLRNFAWPLQGLLKKASDLWAAWEMETNRALVITTTLALLSVVVQVLFLAFNGWRNSPWWRIAAAFSALMFFLGPAVWGDDLPGAAFRVLLPLSLAFNVLSVRQRSSVFILVLGNLSVAGGLLTLWVVPQNPHEIAAGGFSGGKYRVHSSASWYRAEVRRKQTWAWCPQDGALTLETWPRTRKPLRVSIALRGFTPRDLQVSAQGREVWRGVVAEKDEWIEILAEPDSDGLYHFHLHSEIPPGRENPQAGGRSLGFAVCGIRLE